MKKILFLALLFVHLSACGGLYIAHAQRYDYDVTVKRGDYKELTFKQKGDVTAKILSFVVKLTKDQSSNRLVWKQNTIAGGDTNQVKAVYSAPYTTITVKLLAEDTRDLNAKLYYYDLVSIEPTDSNKEITLFDGKFNIPWEVQTPFDGTTPPTSGVRFYVAGTFIDTTVADGSVFVWDSTTQTLSAISKDSLWSFLNVSDTVDNYISQFKVTNAPYLISIILDNPDSVNRILFKNNEAFKIDSIVGVVDGGSLKFNLRYGVLAALDSVFSPSQTLNSTTGQTYTSFFNDTIDTNDWVVITTESESGITKATLVFYYTPVIGVTPIRYTDGGLEDSYVMDNQWIDFFKGGRNILNYTDSSASLINSGTLIFSPNFAVDSSFVNPIFHNGFRIRYDSGSAFPKFVSPFVRNNIFTFVGDYHATSTEENNAVIGFWINRNELNGNGLVFCDISGAQHILSSDNLLVEGYESNWYGTKYLLVKKVDGENTYIEYYAYKYIFDNKTYLTLGIYNDSDNDVTSLTLYNPTMIYNKSIDPYYRYKSYAEKNNSRFIGKKILYIGDSQYNDGKMASELAKLSGAMIIDAHEGGHRMAYSSTSWFYEWYSKRSQALSWVDIDYYFLPISSNDNGGGNTRQSAIDSVKYFYPYYGDNSDTITAKLSRFNALSSGNKDIIFAFQQTYISYIKQLLLVNPTAKIILGTIPIGAGSGSMTGGVDGDGNGIWNTGYTPDIVRASLQSIQYAKREDIIEVSHYMNTYLADLYNEVGLTYDNFNQYSLDGVHWDLKNGEIKKRIAYSLYQELLKAK